MPPRKIPAKKTKPKKPRAPPKASQVDLQKGKAGMLLDALALGREPAREHKIEAKDFVEGKQQAPPQRVNLMLGLKRAGFKLPVFRLKLAAGYALTVNSGLGKYKQFLGTTGVNIQFASLSAAQEFSSLDALFDEVFIHSMILHYRPRNKYNGLYQASGTAADLATCLGTLYFLPNGSTDYADAAAAWLSAAVTSQHKIVNTAENWEFVARNPNTFDPKGVPMDESSTNIGMGWCQFSLVTSHYGGIMGFATPVASGSSLGVGSLLEGAVMGDIVAYYDISVRTRA